MLVSNIDGIVSLSVSASVLSDIVFVFDNKSKEKYPIPIFQVREPGVCIPVF